MTESEGVLDEFDVIASASGGPDQLRRLVLDLALRGRLVEQRTDDGTADELLQSVEAATSAGTRERRGRMSTHDAIPLPSEPPASWCVARLGDLLELINGKAFKPSDWTETGLPIVRIQNLNGHAAPFNRCASPVEQKFHIRDGDLLISWSGTPGTSFGAFIWDRGAALLNQHIFRAVLRAPVLTPEFTRIVVNARLETMIEQAHGGVGLRHITKGKLEAIVLPVPPLPEQHRIVARVNELMALCDELESKQQNRHTVRRRFQTSALDAVANAESSDELADAWQRVRDNWGAVTEHSDCVPVLRQSVLQLAVSGHITEPDSADDNAASLLDSLRVGAGSSHRKRNSGSVSHGIPEPVVPEGWAVARMREVVDPERGISYGVLVPGPHMDGGVPLVRVQDLSLAPTGALPTKAIAPDVANQYRRTQLAGDELLLGVVGSIGKVGLAPSQWRGCVIARAVARIAPHPQLSRSYLAIVLQSPAMQGYFELATRTLAQPTLNVGLIEQAFVPLPPRAEQDRIVDRVAELMTLCSDLEQQLKRHEEVASRLAESVVHALTA